MWNLRGLFLVCLGVLWAAPPAPAQRLFNQVFGRGHYRRFSCAGMPAYNNARQNKTNRTVSPRRSGRVAGPQVAVAAPTLPARVAASGRPRPQLTRSPPDSLTADTRPLASAPGAPPVPAPIIPRPPTTAKAPTFARLPAARRLDTLLARPPDIILPPIQFISDQDEFSVVNMDSFMQAMEYAKQGKVVLVEGHTDDQGSDAYNLALSMKRVEKIRQLMLSGGVDDANLSVIGFGERQPTVPNTTAANRARNRRIEFKVFTMPE